MGPKMTHFPWEEYLGPDQMCSYFLSPSIHFQPCGICNRIFTGIQGFIWGKCCAHPASGAVNHSFGRLPVSAEISEATACKRCSYCNPMQQQLVT